MTRAAGASELARHREDTVEAAAREETVEAAAREEPAPAPASALVAGEAPQPARVRRQPRSGWIAIDLRELWRYRELLYFQALRDVKIRYKQTVLGAGWAVLQPVLAMIVFTLLFDRLAGLPSGGVPYPVTTYCALLPWLLFAYALTQSSNSLVSNTDVITKVYFPRLIMPFASTLSGLVDFVISFAVLLVLMAWYGIAPTLAVLTLPFFVVLAVAAALAVGTWLSALNVQYRDVRYTTAFLTQFWLFATPVAYQSSLVPEQWRLLYSLNPMVGVVDGFRWALLGQKPPGLMLLVSVGATAAMLVGGLFYFRRMERRFADII